MKIKFLSLLYGCRNVAAVGNLMLMEYLSVQVSENKHFFRYIYRPYPDSKQKVICFR